MSRRYYKKKNKNIDNKKNDKKKQKILPNFVFRKISLKIQ